MAEIPYAIIELDPEVKKKAESHGQPVVFGDAVHEHILRKVNIQEARVVVIGISTPEATKKIVRSIRTFTETGYIIVRTRYIREVEEFLRLGADEVIPEEFETSIEIFTRVLHKYLVPNGEVSGLVNEIRSHNYEMLRERPQEGGVQSRTQIHIPEVEIATLHVQRGKNKIIGRSIAESMIKSEFGITVLAIKREEQYITDIGPDTMIEPNDILYLFGQPDDILRMNKLVCL